MSVNAINSAANIYAQNLNDPTPLTKDQLNHKFSDFNTNMELMELTIGRLTIGESPEATKNDLQTLKDLFLGSPSFLQKQFTDMYNAAKSNPSLFNVPDDSKDKRTPQQRCDYYMGLVQDHWNAVNKLVVEALSDKTSPEQKTKDMKALMGIPDPDTSVSYLTNYIHSAQHALGTV